LDFGFWISDFGFWILDFGFWILDFGFRILDFGLLPIVWILHKIFPNHADSGRRIGFQGLALIQGQIYNPVKGLRGIS